MHKQNFKAMYYEIGVSKTIQQAEFPSQTEGFGTFVSQLVKSVFIPLGCCNRDGWIKYKVKE